MRHSRLNAWFLNIILVIVVATSVVTPAIGLPIPSSVSVFAQTPVPELETAEPQTAKTEAAPELAVERTAPDQPKVAPKSSPKPTAAEVDRTAPPYDMEAIKAFDREVYGTE